MEAILNFDQPLDVALLDRIVGTLFTGVGEEVRMIDVVFGWMLMRCCLCSKRERRRW